MIKAYMARVDGLQRIDEKHCSNYFDCPNGNCEGCKNGELNCKDPTCFPYCTGCSMQQQHTTAANYSMGVVLILMITLFLVVFISTLKIEILKY